MFTPKTLRILVAAAWLAMVLGCALYAASRIVAGGAFESNIMVLVPRGADDQRWQPQLAEDAELQKNFLILVGHGDRNSGALAAKALRDALVAHPDIDVDQGPGDMLETLKRFYFPYRHQLLSAQMRRALENHTPDELARQALNELHSPLRGFRPYPLPKDPFNLAGSWFRQLYPQGSSFSPGEIPTLSDGGSTWHLVRGRLQESPFDPASQQAVVSLIADFSEEYPETELLRSGFVFHAAQATDTARGEISTVGLGSLLGIALLVAVAFRSGRAAAAIAATLAGSVLLALAVSLAVFGQIHLITLAFGSTLLGLSVDYCFHFLIKARRLGNGRTAGRLMARGLVLGSGSSILAYLVQLFSPFPGLQQFAVFVASGLVGACFTLVFLAFWYRDTAATARVLPHRLFDHLLAPAYRALARRRAVAIFLIAIAAIACGLQLARYGTSDDIRLLNTSSAALIESERRVTHLLGGIDTQRYWTVTADSPQQVLERTEQLVSVLSPDQEVMAATQLVPSLTQQREDYRLIVDKLYGRGGALEQLCALLTSDCSSWTRGGGFTNGLVPAALPPAFVDVFPALRVADPNHGIVFPLQGGLPDREDLPDTRAIEGVDFVDKVEELSATMTGFRVEVTELLGLFLLMFAVLCLVLYRTRGVAVVTAVLVSLAVALASSAGGGVTLFHILALLLVTGITIDAAIFYLELGLDSDSWLAATLGTATSVLAFGLLALSEVPVLHQFGTVVFSGLLCAWLVTPLLHHLGQPKVTH